jgi:hypothetical protein
MARRRKRKAGGSSGKRPAGPNVKLDKSLPSLPPHLLEEAQLMDETPSDYTGTPDLGQTAEIPDLDERPQSSTSNQIDTGKRFLLLSRLEYRSFMGLIVLCALWFHCRSRLLNSAAIHYCRDLPPLLRIAYNRGHEIYSVFPT